MPFPRVRFRNAAKVALWASICLVTLAGGVTTWALLCDCSGSMGSASSEKTPLECKARGQFMRALKMWRPWVSTSREVITMLSTFCLSAWGGSHLVAQGLRSLIHLSPHDSFPRKIYNNVAITNRLALIGFAIYPTALSVGMATLVPHGYCEPEFNIHRFWPPHTRDDIKDILESWMSLAMLHGRIGLSVREMNRWRLTLGRGVVWGLGIAAWVTIEIYMGPCWYYPRVWKVWFPIICVSFAMWFVAHAQELIVRSWKSVGMAHLELLLFVGVVYIVRRVDVDGFCVQPTCW